MELELASVLVLVLVSISVSYLLLFIWNWVSGSSAVECCMLTSSCFVARLPVSSVPGVPSR
jgi:hypothetical protein